MNGVEGVGWVATGRTAAEASAARAPVPLGWALIAVAFAGPAAGTFVHPLLAAAAAVAFATALTMKRLRDEVRALRDGEGAY
jgi:hypothetical protein